MRVYVVISTLKYFIYITKIKELRQRTGNLTRMFVNINIYFLLELRKHTHTIRENGLLRRDQDLGAPAKPKKKRKKHLCKLLN